MTDITLEGTHQVVAISRTLEPIWVIFLQLLRTQEALLQVT
jgi:hypothetical protein